MEPLASKVYLEWPLKKLADAGATDTSRVFVLAELIADTNILSSNIVYLAPTKEIHLKPAALKVETSKGSDMFYIRVTSPVLARDVYLSFGDLEVELSDNYFDLLPGHTIQVLATSTGSLDALKAKMKVISLTDAFATGGQSDGIISVH